MWCITRYPALIRTATSHKSSLSLDSARLEYIVKMAAATVHIPVVWTTRRIRYLGTFTEALYNVNSTRIFSTVQQEGISFLVLDFWRTMMATWWLHGCESLPKHPLMLSVASSTGIRHCDPFWAYSFFFTALNETVIIRHNNGEVHILVNLVQWTEKIPTSVLHLLLTPRVVSFNHESHVIFNERKWLHCSVLCLLTYSVNIS